MPVIRNAGPVNFTLKYNLMPYVGALTYGVVGSSENALPFPKAQSSV